MSEPSDQIFVQVEDQFRNMTWGELRDAARERGIDPFPVPVPFVPFGSTIDQVVQDIVEGRRKG